MRNLRRCLNLLEKHPHVPSNRWHLHLKYPCRTHSEQAFGGHPITRISNKDSFHQTLLTGPAATTQKGLETEERFAITKYLSTESSHVDHNARWRFSSEFFETVRDLLAQDDVTTATIWGHVYDHFFQSGRFFGRRKLDEKDRVVLLELFYRVLQDWARRDINPSRIQPTEMIWCYNECGVLTDKDWAFCLSFLARTTYESAFSDQGETLSYSPELHLLSLSLNVELFEAWRMFFYAYQPGAINQGDPGLWSFLTWDPEAADFDKNEPDFSKRFFSFAPQWRPGIDDSADRRMTMAVLMTLAAFYRSLGLYTSTPQDSQYIPTENSAGTATRVASTWNAELPSETGDLPEKHPENQADLPQATIAPNWHLGSGQASYWAPSQSMLSQSEHSMLYITACAANSTSINLTLLTIALARLSVGRHRIDEILQIFTGFRAAVPSILKRHKLAVSSQESERQRWLYIRLEHIVHGSADIRAVLQIWWNFRSLNEFSDIPVNLACALYSKFLQLNAVDPAEEVWQRCSHMRAVAKAWTSRLHYFSRKRNLEMFERAWQELVTHNSFRPSVKHWNMRLRLHHECDEPVAAMQHFATLLRLSGKTRKLAAKTAAADQQSLDLVPVDSFNMMIVLYLQRRMTGAAHVVLELLEAQEGAAPDAATYRHFADFYEDNGDYVKAMHWIRRMRRPPHSQSTPDGFIPHCSSFLVRYLHVWPLSRQWAQNWPISAAISAVLKLVLGEGFEIDDPEQRKAPLVGRYLFSEVPPQEVFATQATPSPKTLAIETPTSATPDLETDTTNILARAHRFYRLSMNLLGENLADVVNLRAVLVLWAHFRKTLRPVLLKKVPKSFVEVVPRGTESSDKWLEEELFKLPLQLQLRLLRGDIFQPPARPKYKNFSFVKNQFGPEFVARWMKNAGIDEAYQPSLCKMRWKGFDHFEKAMLVNDKVNKAEVRQAMLEEMRKIRRQADQAAEIDRFANPVIVDDEGVWFMDLAQDSLLGSLRKVPFMTHKEAREARVSVSTEFIQRLTKDKDSLERQLEETASQPAKGKKKKGPRPKITKYTYSRWEKSLGVEQKASRFVWKSFAGP